MKAQMHGKSTAVKRAQRIKRWMVAFGLTICFIISAFGGKAFVPTWDSLYAQAGIAAVAPIVPPEVGETQIHFIDVGQGDAVLLEQSGHFAMIDAGTNDSEERLLAYLEQKNIDHLELLIMTHPDGDHIGGMDGVMEALQVDELWIPNFSKSKRPTGYTYQKILDEADEKGVQVTVPQEGTTFQLGDGVITLISDGVAQPKRTANAAVDYNNLSLCTQFEIGEFSFLDTGDGEAEAEEQLVDSDWPLQATLFKAAHHGSSTSNTRRLLQAVQPKIVVVSCGEDNLYDHPHDEALEMFALVKADVYRTDLQGNVIVAVSKSGKVTVHTQNRS